MGPPNLSLDELTERFKQALKELRLKQALKDPDEWDIEPVKPRTMYRYVEKGLLESGGRGPGARYPESSVHKLVFAKVLQAKTKLSLDEIAEIVKRLSPRVIEAVATGREPLEVMDQRQWVVDSLTPYQSGGEPSFSRMPSPVRRFGAGKVTGREFAGGRYARLGFLGEAHDQQATPPTAALGELADPNRAIAKDRERQWTWFEITQNLAIGARGLGADEAQKLETVVDWLRELLGER